MSPGRNFPFKLLVAPLVILSLYLFISQSGDTMKAYIYLAWPFLGCLPVIILIEVGRLEKRKKPLPIRELYYMNLLLWSWLFLAYSFFIQSQFFTFNRRVSLCVSLIPLLLVEVIVYVYYFVRYRPVLQAKKTPEQQALPFRQQILGLRSDDKMQEAFDILLSKINTNPDLRSFESRIAGLKGQEAQWRRSLRDGLVDIGRYNNEHVRIWEGIADVANEMTDREP